MRRALGIVCLAATLTAGCVPSARPAVTPPMVRAPAPVALPPRTPPTQPYRPSTPVAVAQGQPAPWLDDALGSAWRDFPGRAGIAVRRVGSDWTLSRRGGELFPQQSVSKLWVTLAVLDAIDRGRLTLDTPVRITPADLTLFNQPIAARVRRDGVVTESVGSLIDLAVTKSDNTANDSLLRAVGGPEAVRAFLRDKGITKVRFGPGERALQSQIAGLSWRQDYSVGTAFQTARSALPLDARQRALDAYLADPIDGAAPEAIALALDRLARGELLSPAMTRLALDTMARTTSGPQRLKAGLPAGWRIGHKTGTGQVLGAVSTGYNDIGIITAPDGTRYAVVVMIASTTDPVPDRMAFMQAISAAVAGAHR